MKLFNSTAIFIFCLVATLSACGGGDGDSANSSYDESGSYTGTLDSSDPLSDANTYMSASELEDIPAGVKVDLNVESTDFDAIISLADEDWNELGMDDDSGGGTNPFLSVDISEAGNYAMIVTSYETYATGAYTISWHIYSVDDSEDVSEDDSAEDDEDEDDDDSDDSDDSDDDDDTCHSGGGCGDCYYFSYTSCSCVYMDIYCRNYSYM